MSKTKLTLYVDEETSRLAKKTARLSGKSVSRLVQEFFERTALVHRNIAEDEAVTRWVGLLRDKKTYKELRDEIHGERARRHESSS